MQHILILIAVLFLAQFTHAEDNNESAKPIYQFYHFNAPNPAAVVVAMDGFASSACGKRMPGNVALSAEMYNGSESATHFIIVGFASHSDRVMAEGLMASCPEAALFRSNMRAAGVTWTSERLVQAVVEVKDWSQDSAFMKFDFNVAPQDVSKFMGAWKRLTDQSVKNGYMTNSYGLEAVIAGSKDYSYFAFVGHTDRAALVENFAKISASKAYSDYSRAVDGVREAVNTTFVYILKSWLRQ